MLHVYLRGQAYVHVQLLGLPQVSCLLPDTWSTLEY